MEKHQNSEIATLGAGCFWCVEAIFQQLNGIRKVVSGYSGGPRDNPTYEQVCSGATGHAEVVQVEFNPELISFQELLEIFFSVHDPTTLNKQGADVGTQYRSVIFFHSEKQKEIAEALKRELNEKNFFGKNVVTEISPFTKFFAAEKYHQDYYNNNSGQSYCSYVITPKLEKFKQVFGKKLKQN